MSFAFQWELHRQTLSSLWNQQCSKNNWISSNFLVCILCEIGLISEIYAHFIPPRNFRKPEVFRRYRMLMNLWNQSVFAKFSDRKLLKIWLFSAVNFSVKMSYSARKACSEPHQMFKLEFFVKIVNGWKPLIIFAKSSILDI